MQYAALGLDVGRKRIGVAGCDRLGISVHGITTIIRKSWEDDMAELRSLILERNIDTLVIGLPYNMDGSLGYQAKQVQKFANGAARHLGTTVEFVDERLTSYEAEEMMRSQGISIRHNKEMIDRKAAALILQQWLALKR
ncbi:MAG: Holliday junction resolvase RuvX [Pseudanabaena sp.]|jgi:putative Holliday junction resolvase|uniref:Holliday junction resolvase RuvX n=1 Tax=Pseudanabaena mucicola TaxID=71190 RepID=UPI002574DC2E|nr:Holliday junction resolvase RuvX [Pseudanabaena mucicola]MCA6522744.1 Holliday junction resolvase RuvX [Pseudanabaena sp. M051S1SP2A07QC]MCA6562620.1 Holliday junction resolvase RuvX [Pseudanabaena sp. M079S1SP2A07QC]MCA6575859.1 Holliday junction resolvase RuvX [Pseudanabaena sp. M53BS1SP1A06MG]MCA6582839.1 Holliday junction resolvase RuvX [Pseudanabaena sp. M34BS1SP1A06MG]MCA6593714.1 Holliday junction resolvase RuvX [Pseudanabaena sp. M38BS1SP1A06MG]MCA6598409.1 Holliday junction resolv